MQLIIGNTVKNWHIFLMALLFCLLNFSFTPSAWANNMTLSGTLVDESCVLTLENSVIPLDFGVVVDKYLYRNTRTHGKLLQLNLTECDPDMGGGEVAITFLGAESTELPGLLTVPSNSGIAIGLEEPDGTPIPVNITKTYKLNSGNTTIMFMAYIAGEPEAIKDRTITLGGLSLVTNFLLAYP
jgi:type 1 fimbria pilin